RRLVWLAGKGRTGDPCAAGGAGRMKIALVSIAAILALYYQTLWAMVLIWSRSQTFAHGFVIAPASAWLIWQQRHTLAGMVQRPGMRPALLLLPLGTAWLLADAANVPVIMQYALVLMIPASLAAILGWPMVRAIAFPLAYLLLAVPFGEVFIPPLIDFTARFAVAALQLTGVPVFRENNDFSIPSGNWSVVDACSGLRYVIASLALGSMYAWLNFRSLGRRLAFGAVALLLPILANGLRAYLIVMIGHCSDMRLAVGIDHLVYGWLFFGIVCLLLYWAASFWREAPAPAAAAPPRPVLRPVLRPDPVPRSGPLLRRSAASAAVCVALAAWWPLLALLLARAPAPPPASLRIELAALQADTAAWSAAPLTPQDWRAGHGGDPLEFTQSYRGPVGRVNLQLAWYASQHQGAELLAPAPPPSGAQWRRSEDGAASVVLPNGRTLYLRESVFQGGERRLLVWRWYRQDGTDTVNAWLLKLLLAKSKLLREPGDGAEIIVSAPFDEDRVAARQSMQTFLADMMPAITQGLDHAARR
ncbi:MAG TPA: exosortase A, partial [Janthinobacterium sp.]|nr:exosortase A [Janthinobacterium sp.]